MRTLHGVMMGLGHRTGHVRCKVAGTGPATTRDLKGGVAAGPAPAAEVAGVVIKAMLILILVTHVVACNWVLDFPECEPRCEGRQCGPDECGGSCGECGEGQHCIWSVDDAVCTGICGDGACTLGEDAGSCPGDCPAICDDGACTHDEDADSCPDDCPATCGDGACTHDEDADSCPDDCAAICGDGVCTHDENAGSCPDDCPTCGDGLCTHDEDASSCASDCHAVCGDGLCTHDEDAGSCASDCHAVCGDGLCTHDEDAGSCPGDCPARCGDDTCTHDEDVRSCPHDCPARCGDGLCTHDEDARSCPDDCPATCGDGACTHDEDPGSCPGDCMADCGDVRVTSSPGAGWSPSLVWTGSGYGVAWRDDRDGNNEIYFARLGTAGVKVGDDVRVTSSSGSSSYPSLVWTGSGFGVGWEEYHEGDYEIYFARLTADGEKVGGDMMVTSSSSSGRDPSLAWTGSGYGVAWHSAYCIYFDRLTEDGVEAGDDVWVDFPSGSALYPSLVWTGSGYGVAWQDDRHFNWEIYFARLTEDGVKVGDDMRVTSSPGWSFDPSLVWIGSGYGVAWSDDRDENREIYFARLGAAGVKVGADVRVTSSSGSRNDPSLVWTGSEYGVAWQDNRDGNTEIYFARLSEDGVKLGDDVRVTSSPGASFSPSLVWTGSEYGVAWSDDRDGNEDIYFARIGSCADE